MSSSDEETPARSRPRSPIDHALDKFLIEDDHVLRANSLLLNCDFDSALALFDERRQDSPFAAVGYCSTLVLRFLTTFEEQHRNEALSALKTTEANLSHADLWRAEIAQAVKCDELCRLIARYHIDILLADCYLYCAVMTMLNMDLGSYMRTSWMVRKAWKSYSAVYRCVTSLCAPYSFSPCDCAQLRSNVATPHSNGHARMQLQPMTSGTSILDEIEEQSEARSFLQSPKPLNRSPMPKQPAVRSKSLQSIDLKDQLELEDQGNDRNNTIDCSASTNSYRSPTRRAESVQHSAEPQPKGRVEVEVPNLCLRCVARRLLHASNSPLRDRPARHHAYVIHRLLCSCAFGYGLFHVIMSILSPNILRVLHFFGLQMQRSLGLQCLRLVSKAERMVKAPIASLFLLWYNTIAKPFFALDGSVSPLAVAESERLLVRSQSALRPGSVLYLFFRARVHRIKRQLPEAIAVYSTALLEAGQKRDLRMMCLYELGWCHFLCMEWKSALEAFEEMGMHSKWAPSYYQYLCALCIGAGGNYAGAVGRLYATISSVKKKSNPIEAFVVHKAKTLTAYCRAHDGNQSKRKRSLLSGLMKQRNSAECNGDTNGKDWQAPLDSYAFALLAFEVMYLWRALHACSEDAIGEMLACCNRTTVPCMESLKWLIEGALFVQLGRAEVAKQCLVDCLHSIDSAAEKRDKHIAPFASYELGYLCMQATNKQGADDAYKYLTDARDRFTNYHFEQRLSMRVHAALRTMLQCRE